MYQFSCESAIFQFTMNQSITFLVLGCLTMSQYFVSADFATDLKFGEQKFADKSVSNDVWGPGAGYQKMTATSGSNWCVDCSHGSTGGIKSYPHSSFPVNKTLGSIKYLTSTFGANVVQKPGILAYAFAYDIWLQHNMYEIMLWMDYCGKVGALGSPVNNNLTKGGHQWTVYKGTNGANQVFSFLSHQKTSTGRVDVKDILDWINLQGWFKTGPATLVDQIQLGFEITSTPPTSKFCLTAFGVTLF
uniref:Probable xyloglucan-specific endo-beta-1,4-glucanase A n=1 Tax=Cacopsylla melanoneura TaxID=428564 RepID=A0A8D8U9Q9_9HEMI